MNGFAGVPGGSLAFLLMSARNTSLTNVTDCIGDFTIFGGQSTQDPHPGLPYRKGYAFMSTYTCIVSSNEEQVSPRVFVLQRHQSIFPINSIQQSVDAVMAP